MKYAKLTILLVLLVSFVKAQQCDTIHFINKDVKTAKIIEISPTAVKYYRCDNLTGPLYTSYRTEISTINYSNGKVDSITLNKKQPNIVSNLNDNPECDTIYLRKGRKFFGSIVREIKEGRYIIFKYCTPFSEKKS